MKEDKRIVYQNDEGGVSIIIPSSNWSGTIENLAHKDVPRSRPYLIIDATDIPQDRSLRNDWVVDFSNPDGYGG